MHMGHRCAVLSLSTLLILVPSSRLFAQNNQQQSNQQQSAPAPTLRVTSSLVFLDVTVLDKKGHPVVTGLNKEDFTITEDKKAQRIFSFEAPDKHTMGARTSEENPDGKAPVTILALDLLNSRFEVFAFIRYSVRRFLLAQPEQLTSPAEMLVVGKRIARFARGLYAQPSRSALRTRSPAAALPIKHRNDAFLGERFTQSIDALQQIALENKGVPGRKNIIWVGHGGPSVELETIAIPSQTAEKVREYVHLTTDMLVNAHQPVCDLSRPPHR